VTGVYWTEPCLEPPGARFKMALRMGTTGRSASEVQDIVTQVSQQFLGPSYNLLTRNCNHFTSALCVKLTGKPAPAWLNRAASIGLALPCVVPREWIEPPDCETAEGELVDDRVRDERRDEVEPDDYSTMLEGDQGRRRMHEPVVRVEYQEQHVRRRSSDGNQPLASRSSTPPARLVSVKDTNSRKLPVSERAPVFKK